MPQIGLDRGSRLRLVFDDEDPARARHGTVYGDAVKDL
jgi:hypothetical protein